MLQIKGILKDRIKDINYFQKVQIQILQLNKQSDEKNATIEMSKIYQAKKAERIRSQKQANLLMSLNLVMLSTNKQIQEFYSHSVDIFCQFDSFFQRFKNKIQLFSISMQENLRRLYTIFFNKYGQEEFQPSESLMSDITSLSPSFFFGLIRKWSRNLLDNKIKYFIQLHKQKQQNAKNLEIKEKQLKFDTNHDIGQKNSQMFLKNQLQIVKRNAFTAIQPQQNIQRQRFAIGQNKQNVYAYCLDQMRQYYKFMSILDLDQNYLKSFKKNGKKQDLFKKQNQNQMIQILAHRQNKQIFQTRQIFGEQLQKYIKKKKTQNKNVLQSNSQLILNQKSKESNLNLRDIFLNKSCNYKKTQSQLLSQKKSVETIIDSLIQSKSKDLQNKMNKLKKISVKNQKFNIQFPPINNNNPQKYHINEKNKISFLQDSNIELQNILKGNKNKRHQRHPPKTSFQKPKKRQQQSTAFGLKCSGINNEVHQRKQMFKIDRGLFYKQEQTVKTNQQKQKQKQKYIKNVYEQQHQEVKKKDLNRNKYIRQMLQVERIKQLNTQRQIIELIKKEKIGRLSPIRKQYKSNSKKSIKNQIFDNITNSNLNLNENHQFAVSKKAKLDYIEEYRNEKKMLRLLVYQQMEQQS